jgi:prefoldin subunit 5
VTDALAALGAEIETLTGELDALRADLASRDLTRRFATQLSTLEARLSELSTRRARLHEVLSALSTLTAAAPGEPLHDPLAAPSAATNP